MKKEYLRALFNQAIKEKSAYVAVQIETRGMEKPEYIINPHENIAQKLVYYDGAYNDDLILKTYDGIRITGIAKGNDIKGCITWLIGEKKA